jgi:hypothetical protein
MVVSCAGAFVPLMPRNGEPFGGPVGGRDGSFG